MIVMNTPHQSPRSLVQPKWRRRPGKRPDELLDAALDLFIERGFSPTRVEDIARRAGLSKGAVYLYFDSKEAILIALIRRAVVPVAEGAMTIASRARGDPRETIATIVRLVVGRLSDPRLSAIPRLVLAEAASFPEVAKIYRREVIDRGLGALETLIRRGVDTGVFRNVDPHLAVRNIVGPALVQMLLTTAFARADDEVPAERFIESHLDILMHGLARAGTEG
jgi:AcrR family transcriptional regulator